MWRGVGRRWEWIYDLRFTIWDFRSFDRLRTSFADWDFRSLRQARPSNGGQAQGRLFDGSTKLTAGKVGAGPFDRAAQLRAGKLITALGWKTHNAMRAAAGFFPFWRPHVPLGTPSGGAGPFVANHSYFIAIILSIRPDSSVK